MYIGPSEQGLDLPLDSEYVIKYIVFIIFGIWYNEGNEFAPDVSPQAPSLSLIHI